MKPYYLSGALIIALFSASCERGGNNVEAPATYEFERNGVSTVSYTGQTERLAMGGELGSALLDPTSTEVRLDEMFANEDASGGDVDPFTDAALNASSKSIRSKVAASAAYFSSNATASAQIKADFDQWIALQVSDILPFVDSLASAGKPGQIADGTTPRYVDGLGLEYDQLVIKGLNGALVLDQMLNNYLDPSVLDAGTNREDQENGVLVEGKDYCMMEHKWDEAYGYLFGGASDGASPLGSLGGDDVFMNKYLGRMVNDADFESFDTDIFNALKLGRAAIVEGDYELRDEQADIVKKRMSEIVAVRAVYYLEAGAVELAAGNYGSMFHDLSEGYGFIYSLMFTQNPETGAPYFSKAEVEAMLEDLMDDGANGLWDVEASTLTMMADDIAARFDFTVEQAF